MDLENRKLIVCLWRLTPAIIEAWTQPRLKNNTDNCEILRLKYSHREELVLRPAHLLAHLKTAHTYENAHVSTRSLTSRSLYADARISTDEKSYKCSSCEKSFDSKIRLKTHLSYHARKKAFKCNMCDKSYSSSTILTNHMRTHTGEKPFKCDLCSNRFSLSSNLKRHLGTHSVETPYDCALCGKSFKHTYVRAVHMKIIHGNPIRSFKCKFCEKCFLRKFELKNHERIHTGEKPFKCSFCERCFTQPRHRNMHITINHTKEKSHECSVCKKRFAIYSSLAEHMKSHTNERRFKCSFCQILFKTQATRSRHIKRIHKQEKPHECSHCPKTFMAPHELLSHLKIHSSTKLVEKKKCTFCDKMVSKSYLRGHLKIHISDKSHKCTLCSQAFITNAQLNQHIRKTHLKEKNHLCSMCDKSFFSWAELTAHIRSHTGEKPFKCQICLKMFSTSSNLKSHMTTHSEDRPSKFSLHKQHLNLKKK